MLLFAGLVYVLDAGMLPHKFPPEATDALEVQVDDAPALIAEAGRDFTAVITELPTSELVDVDKVRELGDVEKLRTTSLAELGTASSFLLTLAVPLDPQLWTSAAAQRAAVQSLPAGFELFNALGFWLEVLGIYTGFVYGYVSSYGLFDGLYVGAPGFALYLCLTTELLVALLVGYVLFWCVRRAEQPSYTLAAICAYLLLAACNAFYGLFCLIGGFEPLRFLIYLLKTIVAIWCAFYAIRARKHKLHTDEKRAAATSDHASDASPEASEDWEDVVVTAMDQPTPAMPGVFAKRAADAKPAADGGDELSMH